MNSRALHATVRSLRYRRRLARNLPQLEETLRAELRSLGLSRARIGGYVVRLDGEAIRIEPSPPIPPGQLPLPGTEKQVNS